MSKQRPTLEERVESTQAGSFGGSRDFEDADPIEPTSMLVTIDKIKEYDRNPRRERIKAAKRWFLECLGRHDREDWIIEPIEYEFEAHLAEVCDESIAKVRADFDAIKNFGAPGPNAPARYRSTSPSAEP